MFETTAAHVTVIAGTLTALAACVLLQYEYLVEVWRRLSAHRGPRRVKVLYGILAGPPSASLIECVYLSAVTFSTVGFGDVAPVGAICFLLKSGSDPDFSRGRAAGASRGEAGNAAPRRRQRRRGRRSAPAPGCVFCA
jgi:hypothetical protein